MKIKKIEQSIGVVGKVLNEKTESSKDTYSCDYIDNKVANNRYSTEEIKTNETWIDGKPIYRIVLNGTVSSVLNAIPGLNIDTFIRGFGKVLSNYGNWWTIPNNFLESPEYQTWLLPTGAFEYGEYYGDNNTVKYYIMEYTKTTDEVSV